MTKWEQLNPINFCDKILEAVEKELPKDLNDKIGYKFGRVVRQDDKKPIYVVSCIPFGESKMHSFGDNFFQEYISYGLLIESRDTSPDLYQSVLKTLEIAHLIRLLWIIDDSAVRQLLYTTCGQNADISSVNMVDVEGLFKNAVGFNFTVLHRTEWVGDLPPASQIIKSLYRLDTKEYVEGEVIEEPEEEEEDE